MNLENAIIAECPSLTGFPTSIELWLQNGIGAVHASGVCTRRTEHGFEASVSAVLSVGEEVEVELCFPGNPEPIRASARVIYRNRNHYGFFFRSSSQSWALAFRANNSEQDLIQQRLMRRRI